MPKIYTTRKEIKSSGHKSVNLKEGNYMVKIFKVNEDGTEKFCYECKESEVKDELQSLHDCYMDKPFWFIAKRENIYE